MTECPVKLVDTYEEIERGVVEPGGEVLATRAEDPPPERLSGPEGCNLDHLPPVRDARPLPRSGSRYAHGAFWEISEGLDGLTMRPSILCNSTVGVEGGQRKDLGRECGGHYWLTDGVLREV